MRSIRNCNVAVVGGAGFLGSHLTDFLVRDRNCKVLVVDNLVVGRREFVNRDAVFHHHDITGSEEHLRNVLLRHNIKYVFNYAAYPYVPDSYARPIHVNNVNYMGALKVINAAQEAGAEAILQISSAEIYGGPDLALVEKLNRIDETTTVRPHSSYGAAKAAIDAMVQVRWREAQTPCIALRQFNCVGERETHPYIIPEIISQLCKWLPPPPSPSHNHPGHFNHSEWPLPTIKLGNNSFRDFMYAGDAVRIAVELLERGQFGEVYNLGSESGIKMYDLAKLIGKLMGFADVTVEQDHARVRPWEIWHLQSDNSKLDNVLEAGTRGGGWWKKNLLPLEESLKRTIAWFEGNGKKWPWEK